MKRTTVPNPAAVELARFGPGPREVRLTATGRFLAALAIVLSAAAVAAAIVLPVLRAGQQAERDVAAREAVAADATITRVTLLKGEHPRRVITYRYAAADGVHENTVRLSQDDARSASEGERLAIRYLPSRPAQSWIAGDESGVLPLLLLPVIPVVLLSIAALIAWPVRRDCVLLAEGRFARARIISSKRVSRSHHHAHKVSYEFTTLSGTTVTGSTERARPLADVGASVAIVYHRDNPRWNAIYPLSLAAPVRG
jgi:hypothetical protein